jgi:antimicrobial peptide system SdpB family protein
MSSPFTNVYGAARTLIALSSLLTLVFTDAIGLFRPLRSSLIEVSSGLGLGDYGLFALFFPHLELGRWVAICVLVLVVSGWRPRVTGLLHWWVSASIFDSLVTRDGGDQCAAVLTLLLLPVTLCDPRRSHWAEAPVPSATGSLVRARIAWAALFMARAQVALLYLHAAVGKAAVKEWVDGTAIYYWIFDPRIGVATAYHEYVHTLLAPAWVAPLLTWAPFALEYGLFLAIAMAAENPARKHLFTFAVLFHAGTALFFGLVSFMVVMCGALLLLLRPAQQAYSLAPSVCAVACRLQAAIRTTRQRPEVPRNLELS